MNRRKFSKATGLSALGVIAGFNIGCNNKPASAIKTVAESAADIAKKPFFKLSLAQWSLHKAIWDKKLDAFDFTAKAKSLGFEGVEYVNHLYTEHIEAATTTLAGVKSMTQKLLQSSTSTGMENLLIMIDGEGDLGIQDKAKRLEGVENHKKWIDAARALGCHSIRVNLFGEGSKEAQADASADSMRLLAEYSKDQSINVVVENHGGLSSDPLWLIDVMKKVNMPNAGILPDFGNFCIEREGGERWKAPCINEYPDSYKAVEMMMPYAKAVSAKSYAFDEAGNETKIDYYKMLQVIKKAGYTGYIGVEFEGNIDEEAGVIATRDLLLKAGSV